jgi:CHC2-type zinc finger protein
MTANLTFEAWRAETSEMPGWARREAHRFLPEGDQDACWDALGERSWLWNESLWLAEKRPYEEWPPPKRHHPARRSSAATSTRPGTVSLSSGDDPLKSVEPRVYFEALAGVTVPPSGWVNCPLPHHEDRNPSCQVLSTHWRCFGCGRGGGAIELASELHGIEPRGRGFWRLRDLIVEALLWAPIRQEEDK